MEKAACQVYRLRAQETRHDWEPLPERPKQELRARKAPWVPDILTVPKTDHNSLENPISLDVQSRQDIRIRLEVPLPPVAATAIERTLCFVCLTSQRFLVSYLCDEATV